MSNYILADLNRISKRIPRLVVLLLMCLVMVIAAYVVHKVAGNSVKATSIFSTMIGYFVIPLGVIELISVYSDDFKAKTMQVAIGLGISRQKIVLSKMIELVCIVLSDLILLGIVLFGASAIFHVGLDEGQAMNLIGQLIAVAVSVLCYSSLTMILTFYMQGTGVSMLLYIALSAGVVRTAIGMALSFANLESLHFERYALTGFLKILKTRIMLATVDAEVIIGLICYVLLAYIVTILLFRKRELEF